MKIAIFSPYATVAPHFETELELAQRHLDQGHQVEIVSCYGELSNCEFNPHGESARCQDCRGRRESGLFMLEPHADCRSLVPIPGKPGSNLKLRFETVAELIAYKIDNFDIGYAVLSSLVSLIRDPDPDLQQHASTIAKFIRSAAQMYEFTNDYVRQNRPTEFTLSMAGSPPCGLSCEGVKKRVRNAGCTKEAATCNILNSSRIISRTILMRSIPKFDDSGTRPILTRIRAQSREQIGAQWFLDRVNRVEKCWHSFTKNQQTGLLPTMLGFWTKERHYFLFFRRRICCNWRRLEALAVPEPG